MSFSEAQTKLLSAKLNSKHVRTRMRNGTTLSYIEGWHAISEANRVFGFEAWDRQTVMIKCVWENQDKGKCNCSYIARVRIKVRAGDIVICREGNRSRGRAANSGAGTPARRSATPSKAKSQSPSRVGSSASQSPRRAGFTISKSAVAGRPCQRPPMSMPTTVTRGSRRITPVLKFPTRKPRKDP